MQDTAKNPAVLNHQPFYYFLCSPQLSCRRVFIIWKDDSTLLNYDVGEILPVEPACVRYTSP